MYQLRDYQQEASNAAVNAFNSKKGKNGILVLPTGAGKSLVIADIASRLDSPLLVLQPSKEILEQNYGKYVSYGTNDAGLYSASVNKKEIKRVTFATIGSIINKLDDFKHFKYVLIDECHEVKSKDGMYKKFIDDAKRVVIGLTATPYRLSTDMLGSQIKFITRTRPRVFVNVLHYVQVSDLLRKGFLANLNYYDLTCVDLTRVRSNSTGADYDDASWFREAHRSGLIDKLANIVNRLLKPKSGMPRNGILVFTRSVIEAQRLVEKIPNSAIVSAETPKDDRERILEDFKAGKIKVVANAKTLTTGFDYPALDTVVMARPTKSLSLWYQCVGRAIRPYKGKDAWVVDLCGNIKRFGKVEDLKLHDEGNGKWCVRSNGKQLTNVYL